MIKVLTHHTAGNQDTHWFESSEYKKKQIDSIDLKDPLGGRTDMPPTSVPSPFAQMDLVLTAFRNAAQKRDLSKIRQVDFKLISDSLDIGEIFFNFDRFADAKKGNQISVWDKKVQLNQLLTSNNIRHRRLGEVLKLYLEQDAVAYNFDDFQKLNIIKIEHRVIGGTSPATLFFASPNDLSFVNITMANGDTLLDNQYCHLYDREPEYQKFMYALRNAMPNFQQKFGVVSDYLDLCLDILRNSNPSLFEQIKNMPKNYYNDTKAFDNLTIAGVNESAYLLENVPMRKRKARGADEIPESDFLIQSAKFKGQKPPLVLQTQHDGRDRNGTELNYFDGQPYVKLRPNIPTYYDPSVPLDKREVPGIVGEKYPFLVVSDFLEPYLIRLPYPVNKAKFFDGNLKNKQEEKDFILPIKRALFDYFNVEDLERMLTLETRVNGGIFVRLEIPIQKQQTISFERLYLPAANPTSPPKPKEDKNEGVIIQQEVGLTIFPFVRVNTPALKPDYRVLLVDRDIYHHTKHLSYKLDFFKNEGAIDRTDFQVRDRTNKLTDTATTQFYVLKDNFDYIELSNHTEGGLLARGIVVPKFPLKNNGSETFTFAIDFGTTNTHIEYKTASEKTPKPFEISESDLQVGTLHDPSFYDRDRSINGTSATELFDFAKEILPEKIGGKGSIFRFPQRTIIGMPVDMNDTKAKEGIAIGDFNIPFIYEKLPVPKYIKERTNLKWSNANDEIAKNSVRAFFENLLFMVRAKVLLNGGVLSQTRLITFYPSSMSIGRRKRFEREWKKLFSLYITSETVPLMLFESLAPYFYYKKGPDRVSASIKPAVSIDMGGGTTDVIIFKKDKPTDSIDRPVLHTSFRFAANAIFGDGLMDPEYSAKDRNGFVLRYREKIQEILKNGKLYDLDKVFSQIVQNDSKRSEDALAFFFSLDNNPAFVAKSRSKFSEMLGDDDEMRFVFVVFYVAIIYHIAQLMKAKGLDMPTFITFSGNGSRVLDLIAPDDQQLQELAKRVIQKIYGVKEYDKDGLKIKRNTTTPKEVTCKGGLMLTTEEEEEYRQLSLDDIKNVLLGIQEKANIEGVPNLIDTEHPFTYDKLEEKYEVIFAAVEDSVESFVDFLYELNTEYPFARNLTVGGNILRYRNEILKSEIRTNIARGWELKRYERRDGGDAVEGNNNEVEETFFFYHFIEALNRLAYQIHLDNI
jgi:hypothetical protein